MEVLQVNRKYLKINGLLSDAERKGMIYRVLKVFISIVYIITFVSGPMSNTLFIYNHPSLFDAINGFFTISASMNCLGSYIGFMANEEHLKSLYRTLQDLVDNRK